MVQKGFIKVNIRLHSDLIPLCVGFFVWSLMAWSICNSKIHRKKSPVHLISNQVLVVFNISLLIAKTYSLNIVNIIFAVTAKFL